MENGKRKVESNNRKNYQLSIINYALKVCVLLIFVIFLISCDEIKAPKMEPFIGANAPPIKQEFRWSNGKMPKSFDPARASASPETDLVRALYEGLTDIDPKSLQPIPSIATKWTASEDYKTWTFQLRREAKWSNGEPVIAQNFVDSWKRLTELGNKVPQRDLLKNIVGMDSEDVLPVFADETSEEAEIEEEISNALRQKSQTETNSNTVTPTPQPSPIQPSATPLASPEKTPAKVKPKTKSNSRFGIQAIDDYTLKITLIHPDQQFPRLVAHPIFHPIYGDGAGFESKELSADIVTNGAFRLTTIAKDGITLERSPSFWDKDQVKLERVKFVPTENAESALTAYKNGEIDAITNANFQPLALKLLRPFDKEFHQTTHGAINFYEFNLQAKPFDDLRVREALAISIERERLTQDDMDGVTEPALNFLPFDADSLKLKQDPEKAKKLLAEAGFPNGENFPTIKLVVNRNNIQQQIARSIGRMWLKNLNIKTEVIAKDSADFQNLVQTGDFSLARRGVVLPTNNETSNILAIFDGLKIPVKLEDKKQPTENKETTENQILTEKTAESNLNFPEEENSSNTSAENSNPAEEKTNEVAQDKMILTEEQALEQLPAIPLYFPTSYSLVKPYVQGFDLNAFDALSLKNVQIDSNWQPADDKIISNQ